MAKKIRQTLFFILILMFFSACSEKKEPQSSANFSPKVKLIYNQKSKEGTYYLDPLTQAQVFIPTGFVLDLKNAWPHWGKNFLIKNKQDDFKIFVRFDAIKDENDEAQICKQTLLESPVPHLDSSKLKVYPFLKGEFNADVIVTTDKIYTLQNSTSKSNLFQIRKKNLGCYTFLFIYESESSLAEHSTEKEILEYVKFQSPKPKSESQAQAH